MKLVIFFAAFMLMVSCSENTHVQQEGSVTMAAENIDTEVATFAGGCFWCTEADFERLPGVLQVISGYTGGHKENPTYKEVSSGNTGHLEAIQVRCC